MAITLSQGYDPQRPAPAATTAESQWTTHPTTPVTAADTVAQQEAIRASAAYASFHTAYTLAQAAASPTTLNAQNVLSISPNILRCAGPQNYRSCMAVCKAWRDRMLYIPAVASRFPGMSFKVRARPDVARVFLTADPSLPLPLSSSLAEIDAIVAQHLEAIEKRIEELEVDSTLQGFHTRLALRERATGIVMAHNNLIITKGFYRLLPNLDRVMDERFTKACAAVRRNPNCTIA